MVSLSYIYRVVLLFLSSIWLYRVCPSAFLTTTYPQHVFLKFYVVQHFLRHFNVESECACKRNHINFSITVRFHLFSAIELSLSPWHGTSLPVFFSSLWTSIPGHKSLLIFSMQSLPPILITSSHTSLPVFLTTCRYSRSPMNEKRFSRWKNDPLLFPLLVVLWPIHLHFSSGLSRRLPNIDYWRSSEDLFILIRLMPRMDLSYSCQKILSANYMLESLNMFNNPKIFLSSLRMCLRKYIPFQRFK